MATLMDRLKFEDEEKNEEVKDKIKGDVSPQEPKEEEKKQEEPKEEEKKQEEPKEEEIKQEEPKEEEIKQEEPKEQEKKEEEGPKIESEKEKEKKEPPQEPPRPKEPEPKIPTDFTNEIEQLNKIKSEGNELYKNNNLDESIIKYEEGYKLLEDGLMSKALRERDYNKEQVEKLDTLRKQIMSNLAICYLKKENYQKCIDLDTKIISLDPNYDKSYLRLYKAYKGLNNIDFAVYFGKHLNKNKFDDATLEKYKDDIPLIEADEAEIQRKINEQRAKERKELIKKISKFAIPVLVLVGAGLLYYFLFYKKKQLK